MRIKAQTLSVAMSGCTSILTGVTVGTEYVNLSLRFDRDGVAELCGYPEGWCLWSDGEYEDCGISQDFETTHIHVETELEIFKALGRDLNRQFNDPMWTDHLSETERVELLLQIENAIQLLEAA